MTPPRKKGTGQGTGAGAIQFKELKARCLTRQTHTFRILDSLNTVDGPLFHKRLVQGTLGVYTVFIFT